MTKPKSVERDVKKTAKPAPAGPPPVPPLFRPMDWLAMGVTFAIVATFYLLTLAPELTL